MTYVVRPISDRTAFTGKQVDSQFTVTWSQAEELLLTELRHLKARDAVLELDLAESAIRLDGRPRADARAASPAVRLAFESSQGPLVYATDKFRRASHRWNKGMQADWQHNVYAIAKGLEALRLIDRYGVTGRGEQYTGFKALPSGRPVIAAAAAAGPDTPQAAGLVIARLAHPAAPDQNLSDEATHLAAVARDNPAGPPAGSHAADTIRRAKGNAHPDRHDQDRAAWDALEAAVSTLGWSL